MKKTTAVIVSIMIFAAAGSFCIISAIIGLLQPKRECDFFSANRGDRVNVTTELATPCIYEVKHKVNLIPAGTEYYYAFMDIEGERAYLVRAKKSFEDNAGSAGALRLSVTGKVKRMKDTPELREKAAQFSEAGITLSAEYYLDTLYQVNCLWRIAVGAGLLIFTGVMFVNFRTLDSITKRTKIFCNIGVIIGIISMLGGVYLLNMA